MKCMLHRVRTIWPSFKVLRTTHVPLLWKFSTIRMIPKPSKSLHLVSSYIMSRTINLDSTPCHSTVQQCHRVVDVISSCFERKQYCSAVFLDVTQAFDRVWHADLLWILKTILYTYYLISSFFPNQLRFCLLGPPACVWGPVPLRKCPPSIKLYSVHSWISSKPFKHILFLCRWHGKPIN